MKPKIGDCIDCPKKNTPLTAKRCQSCYWKHRTKVNEEKKKAKQETKKSDLIWFQGRLQDRDKALKKATELKEQNRLNNKPSVKSRQRQAQAIKDFAKLLEDFSNLVPSGCCVECGNRTPKKGMNLSHLHSGQTLKVAYYLFRNMDWMCSVEGCNAHGVWHSSNRTKMKSYPMLKARMDEVKIVVEAALRMGLELKSLNDPNVWQEVREKTKSNTTT